jgi:hypothetical protein
MAFLMGIPDDDLLFGKLPPELLEEIDEFCQPAVSDAAVWDGGFVEGILISGYVETEDVEPKYKNNPSYSCYMKFGRYGVWMRGMYRGNAELVIVDMYIGGHVRSRFFKATGGQRMIGIGFECKNIAELNGSLAYGSINMTGRLSEEFEPKMVIVMNPKNDWQFPDVRFALFQAKSGDIKVLYKQPIVNICGAEFRTSVGYVYSTEVNISDSKVIWELMTTCGDTCKFTVWPARRPSLLAK